MGYYQSTCPHCGAGRKTDPAGKIIYLRSYTCGSYGHLAIETDFTQSVSCMQAELKFLRQQHSADQAAIEWLENNLKFAQADVIATKEQLQKLTNLLGTRF